MTKDIGAHPSAFTVFPFFPCAGLCFLSCPLPRRKKKLSPPKISKIGEKRDCHNHRGSPIQKYPQQFFHKLFGAVFYRALCQGERKSCLRLPVGSAFLRRGNVCHLCHSSGYFRFRIYDKPGVSCSSSKKTAPLKVHWQWDDQRHRCSPLPGQCFQKIIKFPKDRYFGFYLTIF